MTRGGSHHEEVLNLCQPERSERIFHWHPYLKGSSIGIHGIHQVVQVECLLHPKNCLLACCISFEQFLGKWKTPQKTPNSQNHPDGPLPSLSFDFGCFRGRLNQCPRDGREGLLSETLWSPAEWSSVSTVRRARFLRGRLGAKTYRPRAQSEVPECRLGPARSNDVHLLRRLGDPPKKGRSQAGSGAKSMARFLARFQGDILCERGRETRSDQTERERETETASSGHRKLALEQRTLERHNCQSTDGPDHE